MDRRYMIALAEGVHARLPVAVYVRIVSVAVRDLVERIAVEMLDDAAKELGQRPGGVSARLMKMNPAQVSTWIGMRPFSARSKQAGNFSSCGTSTSSPFAL